MKFLYIVRQPSWRVHFFDNHFEDVSAWTRWGAKRKAARKAGNIKLMKFIYGIEGPIWSI